MHSNEIEVAVTAFSGESAVELKTFDKESKVLLIRIPEACSQTFAEVTRVDRLPLK